MNRISIKRRYAPRSLEILDGKVLVSLSLNLNVSFWVRRTPLSGILSSLIFTIPA